MKVADKLDWFEFSCLYTKPDCVLHDRKLLSEENIHRLSFGDRVIEALWSLGTEEYSEEHKSLLRRFGAWLLPREYHKYFDFTKWQRMPCTVRGYASSFQVGDPQDRTFIVRVPLRLVTDDDVSRNFYIVENPKTHEFYTYNALVGFRIVISGHNVPFERVMIGDDHNLGTICPVRFHVPEWIVNCQQFDTLLRIGRVDVALDVEYHFCYFAKLFQDHPEAFKFPHFKDHRRLDYNPFNGAGAICSGVRGGNSDNYLRIYNKAAEQGDSVDFYPWDDPISAKVESPVSSSTKRVYERPWTRFEFELRGACAIAFLTTYFDSILDDTNMGHFILMNIGIYEYEGEQALRYLTQGHFLRLSFLPLWQNVIDSYQKYASAQNQNFVQFREELNDKNFSVSAVGIRMAHNVSSDSSDFNAVLNQMGIIKSKDEPEKIKK